MEVQVDVEATAQLKEAKPLGKFNGFGTYNNRNHLAVEELSQAWNDSSGWGPYFKKIYNLPFYRALAFTLTYTFVVTTVGSGSWILYRIGGEHLTQTY